MEHPTDERIPGRVNANHLNAGWMFYARGAWWMPVRHRPLVSGNAVTGDGPNLDGFAVTAAQVPDDHVPVPGPSGGWYVPDDTPRKTFVYGVEARIKAFPPPPRDQEV